MAAGKQRKPFGFLSRLVKGWEVILVCSATKGAGGSGPLQKRGRSSPPPSNVVRPGEPPCQRLESGGVCRCGIRDSDFQNGRPTPRPVPGAGKRQAGKSRHANRTHRGTL